MTDIVNNIFSVNKTNFEVQALETFRFQYAQNAVYRQWTDALKVEPAKVKHMADIPFLPVSLFKSHHVYIGHEQPEAVFESSGTTQTTNSLHKVKSLQLYLESCVKGFEQTYGSLKNWCVVGLLPSYLERKGSSLVVMVNEFIRLSQHPQSGFYLNEHDALARTLAELEHQQQPTLLIGVTFGLLDFAEKHQLMLKHTIVMETGGMKGRRREMIRAEVHDLLQERLGVDNVHAEYGMTEMLSQAYSAGKGLFTPVSWMRVLVRDEEDPGAVLLRGRGIINVIDLANIYSCSFLATDDAGIVYDNDNFEVLGRVDNSDIRGCSLMLAG